MWPVVLAAMTTGASPLVAQEAAEPKWYERVRFEGDFRLRYEGFSGTEFQDARGRMRLRFRAGLSLPIGATLTTGFRLASLEPGSVTSHNVSFTNTTLPKTIALDRAWLTWTPSARFTATGGKFANPLVRPEGLMRTELAFDDEVSPEGFHQQVTVLSSRSGTVRRLALLTEQWSMLEFSTGADSWMLGGQAVADLGFGSRVTARLTGGFLGYLHGAQMATARNGNGALLVTNAVVLRDGTIVEGGKAIAPTAGNPFARFYNDFEIVTASAGVTVERVVGRMPLQLYLDAAHNAAADEDASAWWAGLSVGRLRAAGDWAATALLTRVEKEAVLSMFSYSDLGTGGTNQHGPVFQVQFRPARDVTLSIRDHLMRPILPVDGVASGTLHRLQIDAGVSF